MERGGYVADGSVRADQRHTDRHPTLCGVPFRIPATPPPARRNGPGRPGEAWLAAADAALWAGAVAVLVVFRLGAAVAPHDVRRRVAAAPERAVACGRRALGRALTGTAR